MALPLSLPYRLDLQRDYQQLQQLCCAVPADQHRLRGLLDKIHDTLARWCLLPDVSPDLAQQLRDGEHTVRRLQQAVRSQPPAGSPVFWTDLQQQLQLVLRALRYT